MTLKKVSEILKGGKGSGDFGHPGRPGKRGGSGPGGTGFGRSVLAKGNRVLDKIIKDPDMRMMAAGLMADGGVDDFVNVSGLIDEHLGSDAYSSEVAGSFNFGANALFEDYQQLISSPGYRAPENKSISNDRKEWEKAVYGKVVNGFRNGEGFAMDSLRNFMKTGKKPERLEKGTLEIKQNPVRTPEDLISKKDFDMINNTKGKEAKLAVVGDVLSKMNAITFGSEGNRLSAEERRKGEQASDFLGNWYFEISQE